MDAAIPARALVGTFLLALAVGCGDDGGPPGGDGAATDDADVTERLREARAEAPGDAIAAVVEFAGPVGDSVATALAVRHSVEPFGARLRVGDLEATHRVPRQDAGVPFLNAMTRDTRRALELTLCAQRGRALTLVDAGTGFDEGTGGESGSVAAAREVLAQIERVQEATLAMEAPAPPLIEALFVVGTPADLLALADDPAVAELSLSAPDPATGSAGSGRPLPDLQPVDTAQPPPGVRGLSPREVERRVREIAVLGMPDYCGASGPTPVIGEAGS